MYTILGDKPWRGFLWDGSKIINRVSHSLIQSVIIYLTNAEEMDVKKHANMLEGYSKALNITQEQAENILQQVKRSANG